MIIREQEPLSAHTTFRIGGPAAYYLIPEDRDEVRDALVFAEEKKLPFYVLGRGSNMLKGMRASLLRLEEVWSRCPWKRCRTEGSVSRRRPASP